MPLTVATAGHIDHGKTTLVEALTGKNPDRLPEERARGISIDLGYAPLELPDGTQLSVVDVPGHERFVRTMVAGATGVDLFLLVIDANEGARPQTHEHLAVLRLLGVERGVVALTKSDVADADTLELARAEAEELVPGAAVVADAITGGAKIGDGTLATCGQLLGDQSSISFRAPWKNSSASPALRFFSIACCAVRMSIPSGSASLEISHNRILVSTGVAAMPKQSTHTAASTYGVMPPSD